MKIDTEISQIRLLITTSCNCQCSYCLIAKTDELMSESIARSAITTLIRSQGNNKMILIYGGEPLLNAGLIKKITKFSIDLANKTKKQLKISIATNGLLLNKPILDFFKRNGVLCSISSAGIDALHDKFRVRRNGSGTSKELSNKTKLALNTLSADQISAILCVHPSQINSLFDNFKFLLRQGFKNFNIEIIFDKGWTHSKAAIFTREFNKLLSFIYAQISAKNYIYINPLNRAFQNKDKDNVKQSCGLLENCLEVWPNGGLSFYPYINGKYKSTSNVGNVTKGLDNNFAECDFIVNKLKCNACCEHYYSRLPKLHGRHILANRDHISRIWATSIQKEAKKSKNFDTYIKKVKIRKFE